MSAGRVTNSMLHRSLLDQVNTSSRRLMDTREQLASGKQVSKPSDDPLRVSRTLGMQTEQSSLDQYKSNLDHAKSWVQATDTAFSQVTELVARSRNLALQGANGTLNDGERSKIAEEVKGIIDSVKTQGNSKLGDDYIFAGSASLTRPYSLGATDTYVGNAGQIVREIAPGVQTPVNQLGATVFGDGSSGLIGALRNIVAHLESGTPADLDALRTTDLQALDSAQSTLLTARAQVGELEQRFDFNLDRLIELQESTLELLTNTRDTDYAAATIEFATRRAAFEAALKTGMDVVQPSLVDFLK